MVPTAISQVTETVVRIIAMLSISIALLPLGVEWASAGAMLGVVIGEVAGLLVLLQQNKRQKHKSSGQKNIKHEAEPILGRLLNLSVPVTASRMVGSLSYLLETILTSRSLLAAGITTAVATAQYGSLQGMIVPLLLLPTALTYSLSVALIPSLSEAAARADQKSIHKRLHQSMRLALVSGAPCIVIMGLLAEPLCRIMYNQAEIAPMLQLLAPFGLFIYLQGPLQAALQALEKPGTALINTLIGSFVKLGLIVELTSRPHLGINGTVIAIGVNIVLVTLLHAFSVARFVGFRMKVMDFIKVGAAMLVMGAACRLVMNHSPLSAEWLNLMTACLAGVVIYLLSVMMTGLVDRYDLLRIPVIGRLFKIK